jgi:hypothetical protein
MKIIERIKQAVCPAHQISRNERAFTFQNIGKIFAFDKLHYQKIAVIFGEIIRNVRQNRMLKAVQQTRFSLEGDGKLIIFIKSFLDRHETIEALVNGAINRAHSARADLVFN